MIILNGLQRIRMKGYGLESSRSGYGLVGGSYEYGNELSGGVKRK
jgi:hypothetical protein